MRVGLIDGYLDEPSCLGVPPYISPHIRYVYGALLSGGVEEGNISYFLIDQIREQRTEAVGILKETDMVIMIAGTTVPGRYLGGRPASLREIAELSRELARSRFVLGGPILETLREQDVERWGLRVDLYTSEISALSISNLLNEDNPEKPVDSKKLTELISGWSVLGARLTLKHPSFPYVVCELETFRGCPRPTNCCFCSERLKRITYCRLPEDVVKEVETLYQMGNRYFRLGCQTDLLAYGGRYEGETLSPNPDYLRRLYEGIGAAAPDRKVLHMDNMNPAGIAANPKQAAEALSIITRYNTPGDVAAFGLESADPRVIETNNINANPEQVFRAVEMINEVGGRRADGIPRLLPGINLLHGLAGERPETMDMNYKFLRRILDRGLMVRRINIRQVREIQNYRSQRVKKKPFQEYKQRVNRDINLPMLKRVFPAGTVLKDVLMEKQEGNLTFGRQLGSYPILVGLPGTHSLRTVRDVMVVDHGYRSVTGLPVPFKINAAGLNELEALPGIGRKRAMRIFLNKPIRDLDHLQSVLDWECDLGALQELLQF